VDKSVGNWQAAALSGRVIYFVSACFQNGRIVVMESLERAIGFPSFAQASENQRLIWTPAISNPCNLKNKIQ